MTLQSGTVFGPTRTSPSAQAFVTDPTMGPGYPVVQNPVASIATAGVPATTLPNPEVMANVAAVLTAVLNNEQNNGVCPQIGPTALVNPGVQSVQTGGTWTVVSNTSGATLSQQFTSFGGPNSATTEAPSPSPCSNQTSGESGTEQRLIALGIDAPQQGITAINAPVSFNGGIAQANVQTFKWA